MPPVGGLALWWRAIWMASVCWVVSFDAFGTSLPGYLPSIDWMLLRSQEPNLCAASSCSVEEQAGCRARHRRFPRACRKQRLAVRGAGPKSALLESPSAYLERGILLERHCRRAKGIAAGGVKCEGGRGPSRL